MKNDTVTQKKVEEQLDEAIALGNTTLANELIDRLADPMISAEMPKDFPKQVLAASRKGNAEKMNKKKATRRVVASVAAFAIVLSFGITAYAQGWFNHIGVLENRNAVVTGENINEDNLDAALAANEAKYGDPIYEFTEFTKHSDFSTACEAADIPNVTVGYLESHPGFQTEVGVIATTNPKDPTVKGARADYFSEGQSLAMQLYYAEDTDDVLSAYCDTVKVENTREFITEAGDIYTLYDLRYVDDGSIIVIAVISANNYVFTCATTGFTEAETSELLNSVDLTALK